MWHMPNSKWPQQGSSGLKVGFYPDKTPLKKTTNTPSQEKCLEYEINKIKKLNSNEKVKQPSPTLKENVFRVGICCFCLRRTLNYTKVFNLGLEGSRF